jgi:hypothetical protein
MKTFRPRAFLFPFCRLEPCRQLSWVFVNLQVDSMDTPALLSTHARLARCPLRPSSPTRRYQRAALAGQLSLFSLTDTVDATDSQQAPAAPVPSHNAAVAITVTPSAPATPKQRTRKRQSIEPKPPATVSVPPDGRLLVSRKIAAEMVSLSIRSIDNMLASKELPFRKVRGRTLIPVSALQRIARLDRPERLAS